MSTHLPGWDRDIRDDAREAPLTLARGLGRFALCPLPPPVLPPLRAWGLATDDDADTIVVEAEDPYAYPLTNARTAATFRVRLANANAPEVRDPRAAVRAWAREAAAFTQSAIGLRWLTLSGMTAGRGLDKYGRVVAVVHYLAPDGALRDLGAELHARHYTTTNPPPGILL